MFLVKIRKKDREERKISIYLSKHTHSHTLSSLVIETNCIALLYHYIHEFLFYELPILHSKILVIWLNYLYSSEYSIFFYSLCFTCTNWQSIIGFFFFHSLNETGNKI